MYISMQGHWDIRVKAKNAAFPQRFIISGATTGNGTYAGLVGNPPVHVTGDMWTIDIQNDPGTGYQASDTRLIYPQLAAGVYSFDIKSNDAGGDQDFNDLVLTCTSPAASEDYVVYGNVKSYTGNCFFNPCYPGYIVIESYASLILALKHPDLSKIIKKLYPERIPPIIVDPNPPDPAPFKPIMINIKDTTQTPGRVVNLFKNKSAGTQDEKKALKTLAEAGRTLSGMEYYKSMAIDTARAAAPLAYDNIAASSIRDLYQWRCPTRPVKFTTLTFKEYDRSNAELAGGPYTGAGQYTPLGQMVTDMFGNYIFRFRQPISEMVYDVINDTSATLGENPFVQYRPDLVVSVPASTPLYQSAPHYNIPNLYRLDLCLPAWQLPQQNSTCFNGNIIGRLGNVLIGGSQNINHSAADTALNRFGYSNHLHPDGRISVHETNAGFDVDCAAWRGTIDVWGCMFNLQRLASDPIIRHFTIRYSKDGSNWNYVNESYASYIFGDSQSHLVGSFPTALHVDCGALQTVPAYKNIQAELFYNAIPWEATTVTRLIRLNTHLYDDGTPGTVYFKIEGYDGTGNCIPNAKDMIALYIDNSRLGFSLNDVSFEEINDNVTGVQVIKSDCNLYRMTDNALNRPLRITFKANDQEGFLDRYDLGISNCQHPGFTVLESIPGISQGINPCAGDDDIAEDLNFECTEYRGTAEIGKFGDFNAHPITCTPAPAPATKWLHPTQAFTVITVTLSAKKRVTNGYNTGLDSTYQTSAAVYVERI